MRLMVGFDGSDGGRDALELARAMATEAEASVLVVAVIPYGPLPVDFQALESDGAAEAEPLFAEARERLPGLEVETRGFGGGSPAGVMTDLAESEQVDLIVVGSPHRGAVGRVLIGSVAENLLHGAPCPVVVAPRGYAEERHEPFRRIAVAYDGTPEAKAALRHAEAIAAQSNAVIEILTVVAPPMGMPGVVGYTPVDPPEPEKLLKEAIDSVDRRLGANGRRLDGAPAPGPGGGVRGGRRPAGRRLARLRPGDARAARLGLHPARPRGALPGPGGAAAMSAASGKTHSVAEAARLAAEDAVRPFERLSRADVAFAGGKGANLGELTAAGLPGPPRLRRRRPRLRGLLRHRRPARADRGAARAVDVENTEELERPRPRSARWSRREPIPDWLARRDRRRLRPPRCRDGDPDAPVAVRSSATARGHRVGLLRRHERDVAQRAWPRGGARRRCASCWSSLFGARTIYYRAKRGFGQADMDIAVVVQRQIASTRAGVMFTIDPATGATDRLVIEGAFGLGESVVSGSVSPDRYVVDKDELTIDAARGPPQGADDRARRRRRHDRPASWSETRPNSRC